MMHDVNFYLARHEQVLQDLLNAHDIPTSKLRQAMHYAVFPGGKRLRPLLVYLMGELIETPLACCDVIAAAIELTHCYSLVHDDLPAMDNDDFRRGKLSCHKAFDEATAILVGDALQVLAIEILLTALSAHASPTQIISITQALVHASGASGMISGQYLDLNELNKSGVSEQQLRTIHALKTGRLFQACGAMTIAASTSADDAAVAALNAYTKHLGLVFQMQDDYLDTYAKQRHGKSRASDIANQKTTFATLFSEEQLQTLIKQHYQQALEALNYFGKQAASLQALTTQLQKR